MSPMTQRMIAKVAGMVVSEAARRDTAILTTHRIPLAFASGKQTHRVRAMKGVVKMIRRTRLGWGTLLLAACAVCASGCQNKLHDENEALWKQNRELQSQLSDSQSR